MKKNVLMKFAALGAFAAVIVSCETESVDEVAIPVENLVVQEAVTESEWTSDPIPGQYIIEYNDMNGKMPQLQKTTSKEAYGVQMEARKSIFLAEFEAVGLRNADITSTYGHALNGFAAKLTVAQADALRLDPRVKNIEQDYTIKKGKPGGGGGGGGTAPQSTPYGTTRVGGGLSASSNTAWVIDSGIDLDHADLNVDTARSISFLTGPPSNQSPDDQNGHGTHVAGTIGAYDNTIGSVGVAPGNLVVAVRVLDKRGSGSNSGVIAGVDYVAANGSSGDVANMSLGGGVSTALDNAVISAASTGVKFVLAAGNESDDANNHSPARANGPNIYTISAMDLNDNWASFSNYGSSVDYCAPGVAVFSTWKGGGYNTISGTSMAAPHAAGVLLFGNPSTDGTVNGDPDGNADAIIHL